MLRGAQLQRGGAGSCSTGPSCASCDASAPTRSRVGGWNQPAFWLALAYCRLRRIPLLVWIESTARDARSEARPLALARAVMVRGASGAFVPGTAAAEYARSLGVELVETAPNAIDASVFERAAVDRSGRDGCTFLYAGRLDPEKGLDTLLEAFRDVPGELVLVGGGSDEQRLRGLAGERVRFEGPVDRDELVGYYRDADVFVLPSRSEPWGMVLNEAAAAGLPLVATEESGAAHDLIDGNGFRVPADDVPRPAGCAAAAGRRARASADLRRALERAREAVHARGLGRRGR